MDHAHAGTWSIGADHLLLLYQSGSSTALEMHSISLFLPQVSHCLSEILELCNSFSSLLHQRDDLTLSADDRGTVDRIAKVQ